MRPLLLLTAALVALSGPALAAQPGPKKKKVEPGWEQQPYLRPIAGASGFSNGKTSTAAAWAGARAGLRYWQVGTPLPRWRGDARLQGTYTMATGNTRGYDLRLGNLVGPQWKNWGISTGPDLFYNQYTYDQVVMPGTGGLAWPALLNGRIEMLSAYAGVEPAWYFGDSRLPVDWDKTEAIGFGDEFSLLAGAAFNVKKLRLGADFRRRTTAYGTDNSFGVSFNFNAFP